MDTGKRSLHRRKLCTSNEAKRVDGYQNAETLQTEAVLSLGLFGVSRKRTTAGGGGGDVATCRSPRYAIPMVDDNGKQHGSIYFYLSIFFRNFS